jgi:hypothetical protein
MSCVDVSGAVCRIAGTPLQDDCNRLRGSLKAALGGEAADDGGDDAGQGPEEDAVS